MDDLVLLSDDVETSLPRTVIRVAFNDFEEDEFYNHSNVLVDLFDVIEHEDYM